jgi:hypothetical protein
MRPAIGHESSPGPDPLAWATRPLGWGLVVLSLAAHGLGAWAGWTYARAQTVLEAEAIMAVGAAAVYLFVFSMLLALLLLFVHRRLARWERWAWLGAAACNMAFVLGCLAWDVLL